jgi:hypothetical protein
MTPGRHLLIIAILSLMAATARGQDVQVHASVSTETLGVRDQLQLTITVSGKDSGEAQTPRLPRFRGFQVAGGPSVSTQFQWINGQSSSTKSFTWILLPEKEGQATLDPVEVAVGNRTFRTRPIDIRVTPGSGAPSAPPPRSLDPFADEDFPRGPRASGDDVFITAELDRPSVYTGQQATLSYHLFTRVGVTGIQLQESPPLTGFWVEDIEVAPNPTGTRKLISGREFVEYVIKKQALFPNTAGRLRIPPSTFAISAKTAGDFFGIFAQPETLYRKTKEISLEAKPLPAQGRPADFSSAVGSFNLTSNLDKTEAATGEAVTLRVKLAGRGNLKMVPDVTLPTLPDFTVYSSKRTENVRPLEGDLIGGDKTWEFVIVPKVPGEQTLPALSVSYFDPERERYDAARAPALTFKAVRGTESGGTLTSLSGINKQNLTRQGTDINFIKLQAGELGAASAPLHRSLWFWLAALLPLALNFGIYLYQREQARQSGDIALARSRRARRTALERLRLAEKKSRGEPKHFYDQAAAALGGYLADKFNLPEIAVTGDTLERMLGEKPVQPETIHEILACRGEGDFGRFGSAAAAPEKMRALAVRIRQTIDSLEML